jgi:hypothetical protein
VLMCTFGNTMIFFILFVIDVCPWQLYVADELTRNFGSCRHRNASIQFMSRVYIYFNY